MQRLSPLEFPDILFDANKQSRCSYPWEITPVGGGFFVNFDELGPKKTVPICPERLKKKGYVYEYAKLVNTPWQGTITSGYLFKRVR